VARRSRAAAPRFATFCSANPAKRHQDYATSTCPLHMLPAPRTVAPCNVRTGTSRRPAETAVVLPRDPPEPGALVCKITT
jgi:hypothetical protein